MNIMPMGDYYVWYCDWCDSRNMTLWTRVQHDACVCAACQRHFTLMPSTSRLPKKDAGFRARFSRL
jgi:hypothetical protein